jgi:hypothetical protein
MPDPPPRRSARLAPKDPSTSSSTKPTVEEASTSSSTKSPVKRPAKKPVSTEVNNNPVSTPVKPDDKPSTPKNTQLEIKEKLKEVLAGKLANYVTSGASLLEKGDNDRCSDTVKDVWKIYTGGLSYYMNKFMYCNELPDECTQVDILEADFIRFIEKVLMYKINSSKIQGEINDFNNKVKAKIPNWVPLIIKDNSNLEIEGKELLYHLSDTLTPLQKLNLFVKFFEETFKTGCFTKLSHEGMIVYRGIIEFDDSMLQGATKSFTSTSTELSVAKDHIFAFIAAREKNSDVGRVILEMHIAPGIRYIDYNELIGRDSTNEWQKEIIFPPGLKFTEIGERTTYEEYTKRGNINKYTKIIVNVTSDNSSEAGTSGTSFGRSKKKGITLKYILKSIKYIHGL